MIKTLQGASRSFKQAMTSGGRVIMATADESRLLNSLYAETVIGHCVQTVFNNTYVSKDPNSETPGRPYVVVSSFRVFSNKGT